MELRQEITDLSRLRRWNGVALIAMAAMELVYGVLSFQFLNLIRMGGDDSVMPSVLHGLWNGYEAREAVVVNTYMVANLICAILGATWTYGAVRNAAVLDPKPERIGPMGAVFWYVVPIANLFLPYRAMKQTYNASCRPAREMAANPPRLLPLWWGFWLLTGFLAILVTGIYGIRPSSADYQLGAMIEIAYSPLSVASIYLWWMIVTTITDMQQAAGRAAPNNLSQEVIQ